MPKSRRKASARIKDAWTTGPEQKDLEAWLEANCSKGILPKSPFLHILKWLSKSRKAMYFDVSMDFPTQRIRILWDSNLTNPYLANG